MTDHSEPTPYLGVTGFMKPGDVDATLAGCPRALDRPLMVGVLASSKTLAGAVTKYPLRYPKIEDIAAIFSPDDRCLNLVHYATGGEQDHDALTRAICAAIRFGGSRCHGVQVNAAWPSPVAIRSVRETFPRARIVLQLGPFALSSMGNEARSIAQRVAREYGPAVTDVLVDMSGGRGIALDTTAAKDIVRELRVHGPWIVGVAGGLCAEVLGDVASALGSLDGISIDAEGKLRDDAPGGGHLDFGKVYGYIGKAALIFGGTR